MNGDPIEMVARALAQVPRDPTNVSEEHLAQLVRIHAALAHEAEHIRAAMSALARRLENPDRLTLAEVLAAARDEGQLEARHGRVLIASRRLDNFTRDARPARFTN
ncbi:MAG: hypothetical protein JWN32_1953 [Solirubrobacterales bacterium]|jgi:hypothetical protein|nr:hypothetical protein [Solirubrobacterales bacterium]